MNETVRARWNSAGEASLVSERQSLSEASAKLPILAPPTDGHVFARPSPEPSYDVVIFYPCSILPEMDGAQSRVGEMLDRLSAELPSVAFYSFDDDPQHPWTSEGRARFAERWPGIDLVTEPRGRSVKYLSYLKKVLLGLFPFKARQILSLRGERRYAEALSPAGVTMHFCCQLPEGALRAEWRRPWNVLRGDP